MITAREIVKENEHVISSKKDSQLFFNAITNAQKPSETLKKALEDYTAFASEYIHGAAV